MGPAAHPDIKAKRRYDKVFTIQLVWRLFPIVGSSDFLKIKFVVESLLPYPKVMLIIESLGNSDDSC
jgi:hypothetical protein